MSVFSSLETALKEMNWTEPGQVVHRSSQLWAELTGADNVVWVRSRSAGENLDPKQLSQHAISPSVDFFSLKVVDTDSALMTLRHTLESLEPSQTGLWKLPAQEMWVIAMGHGSQRLGYFCCLRPQTDPGELERVSSLLERCLSYAFSYQSVRQLSFIDELTGLYNRRYLPLVLSHEMSRAQREQRKVSVLFLDVDFFKNVNDTRGHLAGSSVLAQIGAVLKDCTRTYDLSFRYGGDEFVVVLPNTSTEQARQIAERMRSQIEFSRFSVEQSQVQVTVSIGIATFPDHATSPEQVLHLADQAMYYGKNTSRNIVYVTG